MIASKRSFALALALAGAAAVGAAWTSGSHDPHSEAAVHAIKSEFSPQELSRILQHASLGPPPTDGNQFAGHDGAARLGQFLFFDKRLSADGSTSCATCHDAAKGFTDGKPLSSGVGGAQGTRNAATLWNAAYERWLFWDGRADSLWSQALKPMERSVELDGSRLQIVHLIADDPDLRKAYEGVFGPMPDLRDASRFPKRGGPASCVADADMAKAWSSMKPADQETTNRVFANIGKAIGAYERRLISRASSFDAFVEGLKNDDLEKLQSITPAARRGLKMFVGAAECRLCHSGPNFSDGEFHDIGVPPRFAGQADPGRLDGVRQLLDDPFNAAGIFSDDPKGPAAQRLEFLASTPQNFGQFKTPSLRNVAITGPYMHQGQFGTLRQVLEYYSTLNGASFGDHHQETILIPRGFSPQEMDDLTAFLQSLTDTSIDPALLKPPASPLFLDGAKR